MLAVVSLCGPCRADVWRRPEMIEYTGPHLGFCHDPVPDAQPHGVDAGACEQRKVGGSHIRVPVLDYCRGDRCRLALRL